MVDSLLVLPYMWEGTTTTSQISCLSLGQLVGLSAQRHGIIMNNNDGYRNDGDKQDHNFRI